MLTDRLTGKKKLTVAFRNFAKAPKKYGRASKHRKRKALSPFCVHFTHHVQSTENTAKLLNSTLIQFSLRILTNKHTKQNTCTASFNDTSYVLTVTYFSDYPSVFFILTKFVARPSFHLSSQGKHVKRLYKA
jgi:hypothetical protein